MYARDVSRMPVKISREKFVEIVFGIGLIHNHGYDTIVASVQLGDYFISFEGIRSPFVKPEETIAFMKEPVRQEYSIELAHVVTVILAKLNNDNGYTSTRAALTDTDNHYIIKMEWEICMMINFQVTVCNFVTVIGHLMQSVSDKCNDLKLGSVFWDLGKEICMDKKLLEKNPVVIVLGIIILYKYGKLRAIGTNKKRKFHDLMKLVSDEYEVEYGDLLKSYISHIKSTI